MKGLVPLCVPAEALLRAGMPPSTVVSREALQERLARARSERGGQAERDRYRAMQELGQYFAASGKKVLPVMTADASAALQDRFKGDDELLIRALGQHHAIYELDFAEALAAKTYLRRECSLTRLLDLYRDAEAKRAILAQCALAEAVWARVLSPDLSDADRGAIPRALEVRRAHSAYFLRSWLESARLGQSLQHLAPLVPQLIDLAGKDRDPNVWACIAAIGGPDAERFIVSSLENSWLLEAPAGELAVLLPAAAAIYAKTRTPSILSRLEALVDSFVEPPQASLFGDERRQATIRPLLRALEHIAERGDEVDRQRVRGLLDRLAVGASSVVPERSPRFEALIAPAPAVESFSIDVSGIHMRKELLATLGSTADLMEAYAHAENEGKALALALHVVERSFSEAPNAGPLSRALKYVRVVHGQDALPQPLRDRLRERPPKPGLGGVTKDQADALVRELAEWRPVEKDPRQAFACGGRERDRAGPGTGDSAPGSPVAP
ncbi:MAG: hypothetical protein IT384_12710 [Deltaproteobacteria bacterium]|nr:hypothetical protein [Deltaproteobacteria bacterium]